MKANKLIHLSRYSLSKKDSCYELDLSKIRGKIVIEFSTSRKGPLSLIKLTTEDLIFKRYGEFLPYSFINDFEIEHLGIEDRDFLRREWDKYYRVMLGYIRDRVGKSGLLSSSLISAHVEEDLKYPLSFLIPDKRSRSRSLSTLKKSIHQIWIIIRIIGEFTAKIEGSMLTLKQSSYLPVAKIGDYYLWYEFDLTPHTMCNGILWYSKATPQIKMLYQRALRFSEERRLNKISLRPDIVLTRAKDCTGFIQDPRIDAIIECKSDDFDRWKKDIDNQLIAYKEIFLPKHILIASLKPVPQWAKKMLETRGIKVIDNVYPGGQGEAELIDFMRRVVSS